MTTTGAAIDAAARAASARRNTPWVAAIPVSLLGTLSLPELMPHAPTANPRMLPHGPRRGKPRARLCYGLRGAPVRRWSRIRETFTGSCPGLDHVAARPQ